MGVQYKTGVSFKSALRGVVLLASAACLSVGVGAPVQATSGAEHSERCDDACLNKALDGFLAGLKRGNPDFAPLARDAKYSENNVMLAFGDGLWATISDIEDYDFRFTDEKMQSAVFYGVLRETNDRSPFALRLKVKNGVVSEAEVVVTRKPEAGMPFVNPDMKTVPAMYEKLPKSAQASRMRMIELANGYFDTLQANDGTLYTKFAKNCTRREAGFQTVNIENATENEHMNIAMRLSCEEQFKLGYFRFDDHLRERRVVAVNEERGLVTFVAFLDHRGVVGEYELTNGQKVTSLYRRPHSFYMLETFKIKNDELEHIEVALTTVPYGMQAPWEP